MTQSSTDDSAVRFYRRLGRDAPRELLAALNRTGALISAVVLVIALLNRELARAVSEWDGVSPLWALALISVLFIIGLLHANYTAFRTLQEEVWAARTGDPRSRSRSGLGARTMGERQSPTTHE